MFEIAKTAGGDASTPTTLASFDGTDGEFPEGGLIADVAGDLFGTTGSGGAYAILVAMLARRLSLPVGLVLTRIGLAATRLETGAMLTHDFILEVILPPLLFEAAINIHLKSLSWRDETIA